jgi:alpha-L-fucosidase
VLTLFGPGTAFAVASGEVIAVAPADSPATIIANAANVTPSPRQLAWQRLEETTFIHFGVNSAATANGTKIIWSCNGGANQQWSLRN